MLRLEQEQKDLAEAREVLARQKQELERARVEFEAELKAFEAERSRLAMERARFDEQRRLFAADKERTERNIAAFLGKKEAIASGWTAMKADNTRHVERIQLLERLLSDNGISVDRVGWGR